mmetsp:Transcript_7520/g.19517  ORF Transcript_7520/g.19517 Transcript_7520/m.19517 type:complete len:226 (+) Transcript_7520:547-1224(+)
MMRPRPEPPLPCNCPRPTCVKASPLTSTLSSSASRPAPWSCTSSTIDSACRKARMATRPPALENLSAFETPLFTHCCSRWTSPIKRVVSRSAASGSMRRVTPLDLARPPNVCAAAWVSCEMRIAAGTRTIFPESIRSKSSMSETMFCMSSEHVAMAAWQLVTIASSRRVVTSISASTAAELATESSGLRRSCMTVRISRERPSFFALAVLSLCSTNDSCTFPTAR